MKAFTSSIAPKLYRFLHHKRALGFVYGLEERLLGELDEVVATTEMTEPLVDEDLVRRFVTTGFQGGAALEAYAVGLIQLRRHTIIEIRTDWVGSVQVKLAGLTRSSCG